MSQEQSQETTTAAAPSAAFDPFKDMKLSSLEPLRTCSRAKCPRCKKNRFYYCYDCELPLTPSVPRVTLPLKADIIHHPAEHRSKSTSVHGSMLSPEWVRVVEYPDSIEAAAMDPETTVLLFPSKDSVNVCDLPPERLEKIQRVVLIDSQWQKTGGMMRHELIKRLPCVKISAARTAFWRYQSHGADHLATVEALYWFMREFHEAKFRRKYDGEFDDLLWYFANTFYLIQDYYKAHPEKTFNHIDGYIHY